MLQIGLLNQNLDFDPLIQKVLTLKSLCYSLEEAKGEDGTTPWMLERRV